MVRNICESIMYRIGTLTRTACISIVVVGFVLAWRQADAINELSPSGRREKIATIVQSQQWLSIVNEYVSQYTGDIFDLPIGSGLASDQVSTATLMRELLLTWEFASVLMAATLLLVIPIVTPPRWLLLSSDQSR